jgi:Zn-dependent protease
MDQQEFTEKNRVMLLGSVLLMSSAALLFGMDHAAGHWLISLLAACNLTVGVLLLLPWIG